ncbi:MAG TPA: hypothetical protein VK158_04650 [Acidobacteriota bacterium]|nr:hypothetical protein [Acidobacteriota bacterium]
MKLKFILWILLSFSLIMLVQADDNSSGIIVPPGTNVVVTTPYSTEYWNGASEISTGEFYFNNSGSTSIFVSTATRGEFNSFSNYSTAVCFRYAGVNQCRNEYTCIDGHAHDEQWGTISCDGTCNAASAAGSLPGLGSSCNGRCSPGEPHYDAPGIIEEGPGKHDPWDHCSVAPSGPIDAPCNCDACGGNCRGNENCDGTCDNNDNSPFDEGGWSVYCAQCEVICPYACCPDPAPNAGDLCPYC